MFNRREITDLLTLMLPMQDVFVKHGERLPDTGNHFCYFHDNTETPSAKFYSVSNQIWCFAEQKMHTVYDALVLFGENPEKVFNELWSKKTDKQKLELMEEIGKQVDKPLPYAQALYQFKHGFISIDQLRQTIYESMDNTDLLQKFYDITRPVSEATKYSPYMYLSKCYNIDNYRMVTDGEFITKLNVADFPRHVTAFLTKYHEVLVIFNMLCGKPVSCTLRSIRTKAFVDWNMVTGMLYNLGNLRSDFKYGDPLIIVEGNKDCDVCRTFLYNDTVAILTAAVTKNQMQVLESLTNRIILALDNDESGHRSTETFKKYRAKRFNASYFKYSIKYKDFGDLVDVLMRMDIEEFNNIITQYKTQLQIELGT